MEVSPDHATMGAIVFWGCFFVPLAVCALAFYLGLKKKGR
jgi:hypothetical protein